ncbi:MAG TPA: hypothetical protein VN622_16900 [Clostridia bacterium]|nr:hypothetical protein [Clostridia bacterium]
MMNSTKVTASQRGVALLMCMFALLLITAIAMALMFMTDTETSINSNYRDTQRAYFAASAGLQEARVRLMEGAVPTVTPAGMPAAGNATGVYYILNSNGTDAVEPWTLSSKYFDDQLCHEKFSGLGAISGDPAVSLPSLPCTTTQGAAGWYRTEPTNFDPLTGTSNAIDYKWVRITLKGNESASPHYVETPVAGVNNNTPVCWDGTRQILKPAGMANCEDRGIGKYYQSVWRLTSLAVTPLGSRRMLQMEVAQSPPIMTNAAVDSEDHVTLNGKLDINGFDYCSCQMDKCVTTTTTTGSGSNAVTVKSTTCPSREGKVCDNTKWAIFSSSTVEAPNSSETLTSGRTPPVAEGQNWEHDIPAMIERYKDGAVNVARTPSYNWTCTPSTTPGASDECGTHSNQVFGIRPKFPPEYDEYDVPVSDPALGQANPQITYIPGDAMLTSSASGNGILIVDGDLDIHGGMEFYGLIIVRGVVKFTGGGSEKTNIYGAVLAGKRSLVDNTLGGSAAINFNACALAQKQTPQPPMMLNLHELTF